MTSLATSLNHPRVEAAVLFGSRARGDADHLSDVDVAVFVNARDMETLTHIKHEITEGTVHPRVALSVYSKRTAENLARSGSLFLWHLNLEGKVLLDREGWLHLLLSNLEPYGKEKALRDLATFENVLADVRLALDHGETTLVFEAATTFAIIRNLGIISTHTMGAPCFGRMKPILALLEAMRDRFPFAPWELSLLETLRLNYTRAPEVRPLPKFTANWCRDVVSRTLRLLLYVRRMVYERTHQCSDGSM